MYMAKKDTKAPMTQYSRIFELKISKVGLVVGALFFAFSLYPSMLPRTYIFQSVISAITLVIGYGIGVLGEWLWHYLQIPALKNRARKITIGIFVGLVAFAVLSASWQAVGWQNSVRQVFGIESIGITYILFSAVLTLVIAIVLLIIARSIRKLYQFIAALINKLLPKRLSLVLGVLLLVIFFNFLFTGVLAKTFFAVANHMFSTMDVKISPKHPQPTAATLSGSSVSLVKWETMGKQGRKFVATAPTGATITAVTGEEAKDPIRVYAGVQSADSIDARADLVLNELIRTKAFERENLLLVTTTGSGWIDGKAIEPFEFMNNGDTAVAGVQYSYLPSWISLLADQSKVKDTSSIVFTKVYEYWKTLPEDNRPEFYLYGLSLGSFGVENIINSVELVNEPINGALLAGPPFVNELHSTLEAKRDAGSPAWQPIINNGTTVRFMASEGALNVPTGNWGPTKIAYLQHATDPVVWFSQNLLFTEPDWLKPGQRGPGIVEDFVYVPIVTMWQMGVDLPAAGSVKDGFGHNYAASENVDVWSAITAPASWSAEKATKLKDYFITVTYEGA